MPRYRVAIARLTSDGRHRSEVSNFVCAAFQARYADPAVRDLIEELASIPVQQVPTDCARNLLVKTARANRIDFLFMVDDDGCPNDDFFQSAILFLKDQPVPSVIASPYCCAPPEEEVQVFEVTQAESGCPVDIWTLSRIPRDDAAYRTGIQRVANAGTHCICYDLRVFDRIEHPYYAYSYSDETHTKVTETEDCYAHRHLFDAGVPMFCDWNHWSGHWKVKLVAKPEPLPPEKIPEFWRTRAIAELSSGDGEAAKALRTRLKAQLRDEVFAEIMAKLKETPRAIPKADAGAAG